MAGYNTITGYRPGPTAPPTPPSPDPAALQTPEIEIEVFEWTTYKFGYRLPLSCIDGFTDLMDRAHEALFKGKLIWDAHLHRHEKAPDELEDDDCITRVTEKYWDSMKRFEEVGRGECKRFWVHFTHRSCTGREMCASCQKEYDAIMKARMEEWKIPEPESTPNSRLPYQSSPGERASMSPGPHRPDTTRTLQQRHVRVPQDPPYCSMLEQHAPISHAVKRELSLSSYSSTSDDADDEFSPEPPAQLGKEDQSAEANYLRWKQSKTESKLRKHGRKISPFRSGPFEETSWDKSPSWQAKQRRATRSVSSSTRQGSRWQRQRKQIRSRLIGPFEEMGWDKSPLRPTRKTSSTDLLPRAREGRTTTSAAVPRTGPFEVLEYDVNPVRQSHQSRPKAASGFTTINGNTKASSTRGHAIPIKKERCTRYSRLENYDGHDSSPTSRPTQIEKKKAPTKDNPSRYHHYSTSPVPCATQIRKKGGRPRNLLKEIEDYLASPLRSRKVNAEISTRERHQSISSEDGNKSQIRSTVVKKEVRSPESGFDFEPPIAHFRKRRTRLVNRREPPGRNRVHPVSTPSPDQNQPRTPAHTHNHVHNQEREVSETNSYASEDYETSPLPSRYAREKLNKYARGSPKTPSTSTESEGENDTPGQAEARRLRRSEREKKVLRGTYRISDYEYEDEEEGEEDENANGEDSEEEEEEELYRVMGRSSGNDEHEDDKDFRPEIGLAKVAVGRSRCTGRWQ